jgi:hypothetical protein
MQVEALDGPAEVALVVGEALELVIVLSVILLNLALLVGIQKWSGLT